MPAQRWVDNLFEALSSIQPRALRTLKIRLPVEHRLGTQAAFEELKAKLPALQTRFEDVFTEGALA